MKLAQKLLLLAFCLTLLHSTASYAQRESEFDLDQEQSGNEAQPASITVTVIEIVPVNML